VLFILDENITGFRMGRGGWQEKYGVKPDLTVLGKNVAGGMPGAAVCGRRDIMEDVYAYPPAATLELKNPKTPLSGTYSSFPLTMAAGFATLKQLNPDVYRTINATAQSLAKGFVKVASDLGMSVRAPVTGSVFQYYFGDRDIVDARAVRTANAEMRRLLDLAMLNEGVYLAPGHFCCTSSATTDADVRNTLTAIENALHAIRPVKTIASAVP